jgi:PAS domain S-box-containing protein
MEDQAYEEHHNGKNTIPYCPVETMTRGIRNPKYETVKQRADELQRGFETGTVQVTEAFPEALEELLAALEELQVADEELCQQNEELLATLQVVEAERQRFQEFFEFAPDGYLVTDARGTIREANRAAGALLAVRPDRLAGKQLIVFVTEEDREIFHTQLTQPLQLERLQDREVQLKPRKGASFSAAVTVAVVRDREGSAEGLRWLLRDITKRKRTEDELAEYRHHLEELLAERTRELEAANEHLRTLSRAKDQFISSISHELLTPISSLKLYHAMLKPDAENFDANLAVLKRETERLHRLIEDVLYLSHLYQEQATLKLAVIDLNALSAQYVSDRVPLAEEQGLMLTFTGEADLPSVQVDERLLGHAMSILLTNAFNYTLKGGKIKVSTQSHEAQDKLWISLRVSDNGPGIPSNEQLQLFERFSRGRVALQTGTPGVGLGLATAKEIVDRHGGHIEVTSEEDVGSTFAIVLPTVFKAIVR